MKITAVSRDEIPAVNTRANAESGILVNEFIESGAEVAVIDDLGEKSLASVRSTLGNYLQRHDKLGVKVFTRGGKLYLERVEPGSDNGSENTDEAAPEASDSEYASA